MDCPKCNLKLTEGTYEGVQTYLCESCDGILFKKQNLLTIVKRMSLDLYSNVSINAILPEIPDKLEKTYCSECKNEMEQYGYMGSNKVTIDNCNTCNWLWLDPQELMAMAKMYVHLDKNKEQFQSLFNRPDIVGVHIATTAATQMFLLGFVVSKGTTALLNSIFE